MDKEFYESLYKRGKYGNPDMGRCPGINFLPYYYHWIEGMIFDWGCGNGATVKRLRKKGFSANGMDQVNMNNGLMIGDITKPIKIEHDTALCIDVLEHIKNYKGVLKNMLPSKKQAITVHIGKSINKGIDVHITKKSFKEWEKLLNKYFKVKHTMQVDKYVMLYLCEKK